MLAAALHGGPAAPDPGGMPQVTTAKRSGYARNWTRTSTALRPLDPESNPAPFTAFDRFIQIALNIGLLQGFVNTGLYCLLPAFLSSWYPGWYPVLGPLFSCGFAHGQGTKLRRASRGAVWRSPSDGPPSAGARRGRQRTRAPQDVAKHAECVVGPLRASGGQFALQALSRRENTREAGRRLDFGG